MAGTQTNVTDIVADRIQRYQRGAKLLQRWMQEVDDFDWSIIERELSTSAMHCRESDELADNEAAH